MSAPPIGTVTFLFTDVEGSTRLLATLGDDYRDVVTRHEQALGDAITRADGYIVDTQTESCFVAFQRATSAVAAAVDVQRALADSPARVRMGIHTGQPSLLNGRYIGIDVHRAARICAAAHGGQVLLSKTTRDLVEDELPDGVDLRDLGDHRLKDLTSPQRLSQVVIHGLADEFPSLRTLENRPTNLPVQPTPLIGRERELAEVGNLLRRADVRLLTLTGTGGAGKTRLALQAAAELVDEFPQGVFLVALEPIGDPAMLLPTIARTVGAKEAGGTPVARILQEFIARKQLLLVLDNIEQLLSGASALSQLLAAAPNLKLLATSRTPLRLSAEHEFQVPPLALPDPDHLPEIESLSQYEAVALFVERAQAVKSGFSVTNANAPAIAEVCVRLDGLPLAIELAAARAKLLSPQALLARLAQRFDLLTGGPRDAPLKQQTLRATIDWSYGLLGIGERLLFARLAVFTGGCKLDAAEAVCGGEDLLTGLSALVDDNLLRQEEEPDGEPRFTMLETIRAYALERLEELDDGEDVRRRHAEHFLERAEHIRDIVRTEPDADWPSLVRDLDNFRSAVDWWSTTTDDEAFVRIVYAVTLLWHAGGHFTESARWSDEALERSQALSLSLQARAAGSVAVSAWRLNDVARAHEFSERALRLHRDVGDTYEVAWALIVRAIVAQLEHDFDGAAKFEDEAVTILRKMNARKPLMIVEHNRGVDAIASGRYDEARARLAESLSTARALGSNENIANDLCDLGVLALYEERRADAVALFRESLEFARPAGFRLIVAYSLRGLGCALATQGQPAVAATFLGAAEALFERIGSDVEPYAAAAFDVTRTLAEERLTNDAVAAAWAHGRAMSESDAIDAGLATVTDTAAL
jgi:predicted ATPase/class 3 adenylate cyclase